MDMSLKLAIYFIAPVILALVAGVIGGTFLCIAARITAKVDVDFHIATNVMTVVVLAGTGVTVLVRWLAGSWLPATIVGSFVAFVSCATISSIVIKNPDSQPVGLFKATLISSALASLGVAIGLLIWSAT